MQPVGIEADVMVLNEVEREQTVKADEDFLYALGDMPVDDDAVLGILQVKEEDGV